MLYNRHDICIGASLDQIGYWSPDEIAFTLPYAKGCVVDVGANLGCFSLEYARCAEVVYAFEPQRLVWQCLVANLALNCVENVMAFPVALGEANREAEILAIDHEKPSNMGGMWILGSRAAEEQELANPYWNPQGAGLPHEKVAMRTLDSFGLSPDFIKIDVEGYEDHVLRGARETIARSKPVMYIENNSDLRTPAQVEGLLRLVESLGYNWVWHKVAYRQLDPKAPIVFGENMLCLPR